MALIRRIGLPGRGVLDLVSFVVFGEVQAQIRRIFLDGYGVLVANPEGHKSPIDTSKPLPLQDKEGRLTFPIEFFLNNDLEYLKAGKKERSYSSSITKTPAARLQVAKKSGYGYLEKIKVRRADKKLYKFKEDDFPDLHLNDIKDMLLLITQNKLFNLEGDVILDFVTALKMFTQSIIVMNRIEDVQLGVES
ncbi:hypothetical protein Tco_0563986 [Tanacetum coccineum]